MIGRMGPRLVLLSHLLDLSKVTGGTLTHFDLVFAVYTHHPRRHPHHPRRHRRHDDAAIIGTGLYLRPCISSHKEAHGMTDKELRALVEKLVRDAMRDTDVLRGQDIPKQFIDAAFRQLVDFRAKMQAERHLCYLGRHLGGSSSAANPPDHD